MLRRYVAVPGTWAVRHWTAPIDLQRDWWHPSSAWSARMRARGWTHARTQPFIWSTSLEGSWLQRVIRQPKHAAWRGAAYGLMTYLRADTSEAFDALYARAKADPTVEESQLSAFAAMGYVRMDHRTVICHSHGLQPVLLACARLDLKIPRLVSICSPVREDVEADLARRHIGRWVHIHGDHADRWQWWGAVGDGRWRVSRPHPWADINLDLACGAGHSGLLTDPDLDPRWDIILAALDPPQAA